MLRMFKGENTRAKSLRSSAMVLIGFGGANVLRLVSNLVLTRLLFPEAFGLMALMNVFLIGLDMFSDVGINISIVQNDRATDPKFLNTAWTLQIIRGLIVWLACCALAYPAMLIYDEPRMLQMLPVLGLTALVAGFTTTKVALADRNLQQGLVTFTDLGSQVLGLIITIILAFTYVSVWSLIIGAICAKLIKVVAQHLMLKGPSNRLVFDRSSCRELLTFGKFIFASSIAGFLVNQSDRAILGAYITLTDLGIFSVGYLFASTPLQLAQAAGRKVVFPLYKKFPPTKSAQNRLKVNKARRMVLLSVTAIVGVISLVSVPMVNFLYDERYHTAGPILALMGFSVTSQIVLSNYQGAHLSHGNSRSHMNQILIRAALQVVFSILLISQFGILGAIFSLLLTSVFSYPFIMKLAKRYNAWDIKTDLATLALGWSCSALAMWLWREEITTLFASHMN